MNQVQVAFREALAEAGLTPPAKIEADGKIHRFATSPQGADDAGWYVLYGDGWPAGAFGNHRTGSTQRWKAPKEIAISACRPRETLADQGTYYVRSRERNEQQIAAQKRAGEIFLRSRPADFDHPYLVSKGIPPTLIRQMGDRLIVPIDDPLDGRLMSLQFIQPRGQKRYLANAKRAGGFLYLPGSGSIICICEGYATGVTIHMATGRPVVIAFDCGNLAAVLLSVSTQHDRHSIVVCADDDFLTPNNPGRTKATEAADATGAIFADPAFDDDREPTDTDFNDMYRKYGLKSVQQRIQSAIESAAQHARLDRQMWSMAVAEQHFRSYASEAAVDPTKASPGDLVCPF